MRRFGKRLLMRCCVVLAAGAGSVHAAAPPAAPTDAALAEEIPGIAREGMRAALNGSLERLQRAGRLAEYVERRTAAPTQVRDDLALLEAWMLEDPAERRALLERIAGAQVDETARRQARLALQEDPATAIRRLRAEDRYNRSTGFVNYLTELGTSVAGGSVQQLLRLAADLPFLHEPFTRVTPRVRQAVDLAERSPEETLRAEAETGDVLDWVRKQRERMRRVRADELLAKGRWHARNGRWEEARRAFIDGLEYATDDATLKRERLEAARMVSLGERRRALSLTAEGVAPPTEAARELLAALCAAPLPEAAQAARDWSVERPPSASRDDALYAAAILGEGRESARELLKTRGGSNAAQRLRAWRESPFNPERRLANAVAERRREAWEYVLVGDRTTRRTPVVLSARDRVRRALDGLGLLMPFQWAIRGVQLRFTEAVAQDAWRDAATGALLRRDLDAPDAETRALAHDLARNCERAERFEAAARWHAVALSGDDAALEAALHRLDERAAKGMLRLARTRPERSEALLAAVVERYAGTAAAGRAREEMRKTPEPEALVLSRADLTGFPGLWRGRALRLDPRWLNGEASDGELAGGVRIEGGAAPRFAYRVDAPSGAREFTVVAEGAQRAELAEALKAWRTEETARMQAEQRLDGGRFPLELEGAAGPGGVEVYPRLMPLLFDAESKALYAPVF